MSVELYRDSPGKFDSRTLSTVGKLLIGGLGVLLWHTVSFQNFKPFFAA